MSCILLTDRQGKPIRALNGVSYSQEQYDVISNKGAAFSLLPCEHTHSKESGDVLAYSIEGLSTLEEAVRQMNSDAFLDVMDKLVRSLLSIRGFCDLAVERLLLDTTCIYVDSKQQPRLIYVCCLQKPFSGQIKTFVHQLQKLNAGELAGSDMAAFWAMLDDPYVDLESVYAFVSTEKQRRQSTLHSEQRSASAASGIRSSSLLLDASSKWRTGSEYTKNTWVKSDDSAPSRCQSMHQQEKVVTITAQHMDTGMDAPTSDSVSNRQYTRPSTSQPVSSLVAGMDAPTTDSRGREITAPASRQYAKKQEYATTEGSFETNEANQSMMPVSSAINDVPVRIRSKCPKGVPLEKWVEYCNAMRQWRHNLLMTVIVLLAVGCVGILVYAFTGYLGLLLFVLASTIIIALLWRFDKLNGLMKPHKPKMKFTEPKKPDIAPVFSVRIKLRSTNLTTPVEIIIRQQEQIVGSSSSLCPTPLKYTGISRKHCTISCIKLAGHTEYYIRDENSRNGTELNGEKLLPEHNYPLHMGDHVQLAHRYAFVVCSDSY